MLTAYGLDAFIVENKFKGLKNDIQLILFLQEAGCNHCRDLRFLVEKLASITHKVKAETYNFAVDKEIVNQYKIKRVPAVALIGEKDYGIRYYSAPEGQELYNFLDDIVEVSRGKENLSEESMERLKVLKSPVNLEYFISPTCPYTWPGGKTLLRLAMASDLLSLDIINVTDFRDVAEKYNVRGIPMTVVNGKGEFYGSLSEKDFVTVILENN